MPSSPNYSLLSTPYSPRPSRSRAGMTMLELVAALALFVIIFGILLIALNTATNLWSNSRAQRRELPTAQHIADIIADDLYQALTDNAPDTNAVSTLSEYPSFILRNTPKGANPANPANHTVILGLVRPANTRLPVSLSAPPLSVDAVFYTAYSNCLFRTVIPFPATPASPRPLGELLTLAEEDALQSVQDYDPLTPLSSSSGAITTRLAERVILDITASISHALVSEISENGNYTAELDSETATVYIELSHCILPDCIDLTLYLFDPNDWNAYLSIIDDPSAEANMTRPHLGTLFSRRIFLPQSRGSRL